MEMEAAMQQVWTPVKKVAELTHGAFGPGAFGERAEAFARFFGTPKFLIGQSAFVAGWIALNILMLTYHWDPYPFIALNLVFSLQAAYAAPLILLAQSRQAERDKLVFDSDSAHRESIAQVSVHNQYELVGITDDIRAAIAQNATMLEDLRTMVSNLATTD